MKQACSLLLLLILANSCTEQNKTNLISFAPKTVEAKGYTVPEDSLQAPITVTASHPTITKVGKPIVTSTNLKMKLVIHPKKITPSTFKIVTPGKGNSPLPIVMDAIDSSFVGGLPEVILAKDPHLKDQNPHTFSSYGKLQGLKHDHTTCVTQDQSGNLWFGTAAGVIKYDGKNFTHYSKKEGLSSIAVYCITEDKHGQLWFGTNGSGVTKYDGKKFTHYTTKEGLSSNIVYSIKEDKHGNLWFATRGGGVSKYDGKKFTHFTTDQGLTSNDISCVTEDKHGALWFGSSAGLNKYDGVSFTQITTENGLMALSVGCICEDKNGDLWFDGGPGTITRFDGKTFAHYTSKEGFANQSATSIIKDRNNDLWFGTYGAGIIKYDGFYFTHYTDSDGLADNYVWNMTEDKSGNIWCCTYHGGISKYDGSSFRHFTDKEGLLVNNILTLTEDKKGNIWFGGYGSGATKYDGKTFTHYPIESGMSSGIVWCVTEDRIGNLWFGTSTGLVKFDGEYYSSYTVKEGLAGSDVRCITEDRNGNLWCGTSGGGVSKFDGKSFTNFTKKEGLSANIVYAIIEDKNGNIWFGTSGGGITKYDQKNFIHYKEKQVSPLNVIFSIKEDKSGDIWFGTNGSGVLKYDKKNFTFFSEKEGLSNNFVASIEEDNEGNLWFGTRIGINKLEMKNLTLKTLNPYLPLFKQYNYEDGLLGLGVNGGKTICNSKNGTLWLASNNRLTAFNPKGEIADTIPPNIQLTSIDLFNETIGWANLEHNKDTILTLGNGVKVSDFRFDSVSRWFSLPENLSLPSNNNSLTFNFIGITMNQPNKIKYQYKLEGIDENWSALTTRADATYGNLSHGYYTFRLKAMNSEGFWSNEFNYSFTIRPPWWQTWWFRIIVGLIIVGSIVFYIKWRERTLKAEKEILEQTVIERTKEVVKEKKIVEEQKHLVEEKHKEITDSINYAERIQRALLASKKLLDENLTDYFILFKPKDVVSGDFYWATKLSNNNFVLVTADSTGHGVPGAIMSIVNIASLKEAALQGITSPDMFLNETRRLVIENLKNDGSAEGGKDGMDGSLLSFDFKNNLLSCASANNPVWVIRGKELIEIKADRIPIGKHDKDNTPFTLHTLNLQKGDVIYTLTDGFPDQFGGASGKKFKQKQLQELLLSVASESMETQKQKLNDIFDNWKGNLEQVDDVCLIGVRI